MLEYATISPLTHIALGNRGAAVYSADRIDYDLDIITYPGFNVDNATLATVPQLTDDGYRDSGVFTAALGINSGTRSDPTIQSRSNSNTNPPIAASSTP